MFRDAVDAYNSGDPDEMLSALPPDFTMPPDPSFPEQGPFRGEELRTWLRGWTEAWESIRLEIIDLEERARQPAEIKAFFDRERALAELPPPA